MADKPVLEVLNGNLHGEPGMVIVRIEAHGYAASKSCEPAQAEAIAGGLLFMAKEIVKEQKRARRRAADGDSK